MSTVVARLDLHSTSFGMEAKVLIIRHVGDEEPVVRTAPALATDLPADVRIALMKWLIEGLPKGESPAVVKGIYDRWPDIGLPVQEGGRGR